MTIKDPFAHDNEVAQDHAEAQTFAEAGLPEPDDSTKVIPRPAPPSEGKIVQTYKEGTGFDSSWVVVHSDTVKDALAVTYDPEFKELLDRTKLIATGFRGGSAPSTSGATRGAAPQGATEPPSWFPAPPAPDWVYKTGFKNGKTWHAWAPAEKGGGDWQFHRQP